MTPLAAAIAVLTITGNLATFDAHAQARPFSSGWMAAKGAAQAQAAATGRLPNGMLAGMNSAAQQQQQAQQKLNRSVANLGSAAAAIAAQQAAQAAARAAAQNDPSVPDGLAEGGLKIDGTRPLSEAWLNAKAPVQSQSGGRTTVAIEQTKDKAILNWETFNVGKNTTVDFKQQSNWAVLNRVNDPQARPSQIQGQIKGNGTVMIANANGVVFSGTSQVNVRNLVAAAATITDDQFTRNGLYGKNNAATFTQAGGKIEVQAGAQIATHEAGSVTRGGGYVLLMGSQVSNAGTITTRKGQAQLAAGDAFIIRKGVGTDANTASTTRGNEVAPQFNVDSTAGTVSNSGLILAREGDITLAGRDVRQNGVAVSTTTVNTRGTVHLLNSISDERGQITLSPNATTAVLIEDDGKTTALDSQRDALIKESGEKDLLRSKGASGVFDNLSILADRRDQSRIEIVSGGNVVFEGDSLTLATGGQIVTRAARRSFVADQAQLDVSGAVGVQVAMESNNVKVNVQGFELRDAPLNRDSGKLFNNDVWIDRRQLVLVPKGTGGYESDRWYTSNGLLEVGGYLGTQGHSIGEWAAQGGTVLLGGSEVITQVGSAVNLAGGTLDVATGYVNQTWLRGSDGRLYSLDKAPADMVFGGIYKGYEAHHARWDITETFYNPMIGPRKRLENGYTVGRDAGRMIVSAPTAVLEGDIVADVFNGSQQSRKRDAIEDGYKQAQTAVARTASFSVGRYSANEHYSGLVGAFDSDMRIRDLALLTPELTAFDLLPFVRIGTVWLDAQLLNEQGLSGLSLATSSSLSIDAPLVLADGGSLSLSAPVVDLNANLTVRGGSVLATNRFVEDGAGKTLFQDGSAAITVAPGVMLDVRGLWVNTLLNPQAANRLAYLDGGTVWLSSTGDVTLAENSVIDVSSGGAMLANRSTRSARGGSVTLHANESGGEMGLAGTLTLNGAVRGYGLGGSGTLSLQTGSAWVVGGHVLQKDGELAAGEVSKLDLVLDKRLELQAGDIAPIDINLTRNEYKANETTDQSVQWGTEGLDVNFRVGEAGWKLPPGMMVYVGSNRDLYSSWQGDVVPPGAIVLGVHEYSFLDTGYFIDPASLPDGIPLPAPVRYTIAAGHALPEAVSLAAGRLLPAGTSLNQTVAVRPLTQNIERFLDQGFSRYEINAQRGLVISGNTVLAPVVQSWKFNEAAYAAVSGAHEQALALTLDPLFVDDPLKSSLTQRRGADLVLRSGQGSESLDGGPIYVGENVRIRVDPGKEVLIASGGQLTVEGHIEALGGRISLLNQQPHTNEDPGALSVWIGTGAVLDASGHAYVAHNVYGKRYGIVLDGGTIVLGSLGDKVTESGNHLSTDAFVIVRPGAVLDVSGASATFDVQGAGRIDMKVPAASISHTVASDGGEIAMRSYSGIYNEGSLRAAAGGAGASGGSFVMQLESPIYSFKRSPTEVPAHLQLGRVITVSQNDLLFTLSPELKPEQPDVNLRVGHGGVIVDQIQAGGFDSISLWGRSGIAFDGDVNLKVGRSISLLKGTLLNTGAESNATLAAPHIFLDGQTTISLQPNSLLPSVLPVYPRGGKIAINAGLIDVRNRVSVLFADTQLTSQTDLRFLKTTDAGSGSGIPVTVLAAAGNLDLVAGQVYPASGALVKVYAGATIDHNGLPTFNEDAVLSISRPEGGLAASKPYSVFGDISLSASQIRQGGTLIAPLGTMHLAALGFAAGATPSVGRIQFLSGSLTSVSAAGLVIPYGGTVDGVDYTVDGGAPVNADLLTGQLAKRSDAPVQGISINATNIVGEQGSMLDLSGGGTLAGAAFIAGRGGSVDTLLNPLIAGGKVYAILPGATTAPVAGGYNTAWEGVEPGIGQQVTIPAGVPGLPAGTYTLLPANYALLPGAYRIEVGERSLQPIARTHPLPNGSYILDGVQGIAGTGIRDSLSARVTVTPGAAFRTYSQYNEQSYEAFQLAKAAAFGTVRPLLERDGKFLSLTFFGLPKEASPTSNPALTWNGAADFSPISNGYSGTLAVRSNVPFASLIITAPDSQTLRNETVFPIAAHELTKIGAPNLYVGGVPILNVARPNTIQLGDYPYITGALVLEAGAVLKGAQVFLAANERITLGAGARIDTRDWDVPIADSSTGYFFGSGGTPLLVASNGSITLTPSLGLGSGSIQTGDGASIYAKGTVGFSAAKGISFAGTPLIGAHELTLALPSINFGEADVLAAAQAAGKLPSGMSLTQELLTQLLAGNPSAGVSATKNLVLSASQSLNFFGSVDLGLADPHSGKPLLSQLLLSTPAIYGLGKSGEAARLAVDTLVWSGMLVPRFDANYNIIYENAMPGVVLPDGPGTGQGSLIIDAHRIVFGYPEKSQPNNRVATNWLMLGFSSVNLMARDSITANNKGSLAVFTAGADPSVDFDPKTYAGIGGALNLVTPVLTGEAGSVMAYRTGGALTLAKMASDARERNRQALGAEISLNADSIDVSSAITLPSGKLSMTAIRDIVLADGAYLDMSGRSVSFFDVSRSTWGGDISLESSLGQIVQRGGATIDVSSENSHGGTLKLTALEAGDGRVSLGGVLRGNGGKRHKGGSIDLRAQLIGGEHGNLSTNFAALNTGLNEAGFTESRSFILKQGNLVIGDELRAHELNVSLDGGSLQVQGKIDASGAMPGIIRLAARDDLILGSDAMLDVSATVLHTDSYGQPIHAKNRGHIELSSRDGWLRLNPAATLILLSADGVARGQVELNAGRTQPSSGQLRVQAAGPLHISGAQDIFINAVQAYELADGAQIDQALLDVYDQASLAFMQAAHGPSGNLNSSLQTGLAGLLAYGPAVHLRPGLELRSSGDLYTVGDIDLSRYRYGPDADRLSSSARYGAGEALSLVVRAAGNLNIQGSVSDGFKAVMGIAPTYKLISDVGLENTDYFSYIDYWWAPPYYKVAQKTHFVVGPEGWEVPYLANGDPLDWGAIPKDHANPDNATQFWGSGESIPAGTVVYLVQIPAEISSGYMALNLATDPGTPSHLATSPMAAMLAAGSQSASMRWVAGADLSSADSRALQAASSLSDQGNLTLADPCFSMCSEIFTPSVMRTGTGSLELLAGGNIAQDTAYGIYTAGMQADSSGLALPSGSYLADHGGDLRIAAQGNLTGYVYEYQSGSYNNYQVSNWLWREGDEAAGTKATWSINFGAYATDSYTGRQYVQGFNGFGALGGGNVSLLVGGDAGIIAPVSQDDMGSYISQGLVVAVGSSGGVLSVEKSEDGRVIGGTLTQAGGGDLTVKIGGRLNPGAKPSYSLGDDFNGSFTNVRGDTLIEAGMIGSIPLVYNQAELGDPRGVDPYRATLIASGGALGGPVLLPGDGSTSLRARGDLVLGGVGDPGQVLRNASSPGAWFSLWQPTTSIALLSAGGNVTPFNPATSSNESWSPGAGGQSLQMQPAQFEVVAASGSIYAGGTDTIELAPSAQGHLELLAYGSIYGAAFIPYNSTIPYASLRFNVSGTNADLDSIPNPFKPAFRATFDIYNGFYVFQRDTVTSNLHAGAKQPIRVYAVSGDLLNVALGEAGKIFNGQTNEKWTQNIAAKAVRALAGRDIVNFGGGAGENQNPGLILNANSTDVSVISAGRDMFYTNVQVAGPGILEVSAGRNLYQGDKGSIVSIGPIVIGDSRSGADIVLLAGAGAAGPDYARLLRYLDPTNLLAAGTPLEGSGKVAKTYETELADWLKDRYGFAGMPADVIAYFSALAPEQQPIFLRQIYYAELKSAGREYNDPSSKRYGSYLRGRDMIATLFPDEDTDGNPIVRQGDITMFGDAGVRTLFGGNIDLLAPAGQIVLGIQGRTPSASSGLLTQGSGDISIYSKGSVLLGLSRVMTTFGGDIQAWSATGDINAGRGSKTTQVFTPSKRVYDELGNVTISPQVPSTGAGIATLNPIPEVEPGDIDLIAPLGTIDAGEAGIRVSGNVNIAALHVVNAANIQVQGETVGVPVAAVVNTGALTSASAASTSAATAAQDSVSRARNEARQNQPSIFSVQILGFGGESASSGGTTDGPTASGSGAGVQSARYRPNSAVQVVGDASMGEAARSQLTRAERKTLGL